MVDWRKSVEEKTVEISSLRALKNDLSDQVLALRRDLDARTRQRDSFEACLKATEVNRQKCLQRELVETKLKNDAELQVLDLKVRIANAEHAASSHFEWFDKERKKSRRLASQLRECKRRNGELDNK